MSLHGLGVSYIGLVLLDLSNCLLMSLSAGLPKLSYSNRVFGCSIPFSQQLKRYEPSQILSPLSTNHVRATSSQHGVASRGKQLKEDFKARHKEGQRQKLKAASTEHTATLSKWDLTIGLEIHAQLNTQRKLFSGFCRL